MPINTLHPDYEATIEQVNRVRDCDEGQDAIKGKGELYLSRLDGQSDNDYKKYKKRAYFLPVVKPVSIELTGKIMRKEPIIEKPDTLNVKIGDNQNLSQLASMCIRELFISGRGGVLVEHDGETPVFKFYNRESIVNWSNDFVILQQSYQEHDDKDIYKIENKIEYLELLMLDGVYTQRLWRQAKGKQYAIVDVTQPTKRGDAITSIPFVFFNTMSANDNITPPALLQIANTNLDHYRLSTDLRHGMHFLSIPTVFIYGDIRDENNQQIKITAGAGSFNHITDTEARAEMLEFKGDGLKSIRESIKEDVSDMVAGGARMFSTPTLGVKAAETARIESSGESATLSTIANSVEDALTQMYVIAAEWQSINSEGISVTLNRDFLNTRLSAQDLTALLSVYVQGGISLEAFVSNLKKGELLQKDTTVEEEISKINGGEVGFV